MPHSAELMKRLATMVESEYKGCDYYYDKGLNGTGRRPDAYVMRKGSLVAVFEVGYTDAAKIALYRKLLIPDIRWYDKALNLVLREAPSLPKPPPAKKLDLPFRKVNGPAGWAVPILESRIMPPPGLFADDLEKTIREVFPGPFGYFPYPFKTTCMGCMGRPTECEKKEASLLDLNKYGEGPDDCDNAEYVFFDDQVVMQYADCDCTMAHEGWVIDGSLDEYREGYGHSYHHLCDMLLAYRIPMIQHHVGAS